MKSQRGTKSLHEVAPELEPILNRGGAVPATPAQFEEGEIRVETKMVAMRDGNLLATDLYLPPVLPAPVIALRTPYGRAAERMKGFILAFARRGYVVVSQDCRGTGGSEPDYWDYYIYEPEDSFDCVEWVTQQSWCNGHIFSFGSSYASATQWCMAANPKMSAIVPEVGGLQTTRTTVRPHMFVNGYPRSVGKGPNRQAVAYTDIERLIEAETLSTGYFNESLTQPLPQSMLTRYPHLRTLPLTQAKRWLWSEYCSLPPAKRSELVKEMTGEKEFSYIEMCSMTSIFDSQITYGVHTIPSTDAVALCRKFRAPALIVTGWYDWNLADQLPSWVALRREAAPEVANNSRLLITPSAHNMTGYHEGENERPELQHNHRNNIDLMLCWYEAVRERKVDAWPTVIYYLMGANEWRTASDWPLPEAQQTKLYLGSDGALAAGPPSQPNKPDQFVFDPENPAPTVGGSIVSFLYKPGSADVSEAQRRADVLTYTTELLAKDLDVVGPLQLVLYASSSAVDTDFSARLSDVFPDGRAIQLQSGMLRARYRNLEGAPELLEPGRVYRFEIDLWSTANRFKAGHRLRVDISSADFPRFDRNTNRGGEEGPPVRATQTIYHDPEHPSHLVLSTLEAA
jgi:predicted acyl esterase